MLLLNLDAERPLVSRCTGGFGSGRSCGSVWNERKYWQGHIQAQARRRSGSTQTAYCLRHELHPDTYRSWRDHLRINGALISTLTSG